MLVKIRAGAQLSAAEQEFVDCLRSYPSTGLAAVDVHVGMHGTRQIDAVVITPRGITVAEIRGFRKRQSGILNLTGDGPWQVSAAPAALDDSDTSPTDRLEQCVYAVRAKIERALQDPGDVCGVVVLVPQRGAMVRPARTSIRPGIDVVIANVDDATELRIYLEGFSAGARSWTVDRVVQAAQVLGMDPKPSRAELLADGFDEVRPAPLGEVTPAAKPPRPPRPPHTPGPHTRRQQAGAWGAVVVAVIGMLLVFWVVAKVFIDGPADSGPAPTTTISVTPTPPPTTRHCWPFQPDC
ncbi:nuclease-related domain-containing protein [Nocardia goodfellowii]|uniref:nuclease-related domain-containing protein n=1 Tax=Nocardia goodfellowii TaxID=882446 RepID=UPI001AE994CB|nr:nuclease-related domain-containing protein [Nocardia goodfellowii]